MMAFPLDTVNKFSNSKWLFKASFVICSPVKARCICMNEYISKWIKFMNFSGIRREWVCFFLQVASKVFLWVSNARNSLVRQPWGPTNWVWVKIEEVLRNSEENSIRWRISRYYDIMIALWHHNYVNYKDNHLNLFVKIILHIKTIKYDDLRGEKSLSTNLWIRK